MLHTSQPVSLTPKMQVALVGASLTATFSEQLQRWPPYRIDNLTSLKVRFRQHISATDGGFSDLLFPPLGGYKDGSAGSDREGGLPWDYLLSRSSSLFAWDYPLGGARAEVYMYYISICIYP